MIVLVLLLIAVVLAALAAFGVGARVQLGWLAVAFVALALAWPALAALAAR